MTAVQSPAPGAELGYSARVLARVDELAAGLGPSLRGPVAALAANPGKSLRSGLLAACVGDVPVDPARLVRLGALVELVHLASLIHDDVVDRAALRRGQPTAHTLVGPERASLAGLAAFALAGTESADLGAGVAMLVSRTLSELAHGQLLDIERTFDTTYALQDYLELTERKTGVLFQMTCLLGAAEAARAEREVRALSLFGREFGIAFQMLDDCLDLTPGDLDKSVGTDHMLGLFGAPTLSALAADDSGALAELLLSPSFTAGDLPAVRALIESSGGLDRTMELAREHLDLAREALDDVAEDARTAILAIMAKVESRL
ncbi:polyprenyl synthetase family protein [Actinomadura rifamycini]|uniref:polyprenyl synthetase family protein n=1 Tax=Actinomadura rifamycini TaxID=31962 RepID=UPI00041E4691|nr:polyprenyl synthetase family protein [Actinomadura rifamycini]